ncbi:hypothetical protein CBR_g40344 [Chara braunii]|uniref:Fungal lipase-type domain-containing protein n=1 Tax=Chara braunii TaxID=69332 RepID=A0A388LTH3_CHABU|nr:hypothetical protein CBR_g40344 [Chara braunii]|eukprot:GBG85616.1 hypothetical protein CBR_g40344 [Chara braunii]
MGREEMECNASSSAEPCYTEPNSRAAEEKSATVVFPTTRYMLGVLRKLLHHGFLGMIISVALTLVSSFAKIARSFLGGRVTDLIMRLISWFLGRGGNVTRVTSVSFVNFLEDNFEIRGTGFPVHSNTLTATNAEVLILASKLAYENMSVRVVTQVWEMEWVAGYSFEPQGTQVFVFKHKTAIVVAFRGTEPFNLFDWLVDLETALKSPRGTDKNPDRALLGNMHAGFYDALMTPPNSCRSIPWYRLINADGIATEMGLLDESRPPYDIVRDRVMEELRRDKDLYVFVTGHSLGAALASVFCAHLLVDEDPENLVKPRVQLLCTFGQPRTGGYKFARFLDCAASTRMTSMIGEDGKLIGFRYLRFVNNKDIVPRLPPPVRFSHSPCFVFLNELGYEEIDCETEGLSVAGVVLDEVVSRARRSKELFFNCVLDLASFKLTKPIVRFVVYLLPNLIYNHFASEYERVIRGCPDPYFNEDQWVQIKWPVFVFKHKTAIVVAFRGTEPFNLFDWLVDLEFALKAPQGTDKNPDRALLGKVHAGFYDALMTPPNCRRSIPCYRVISADGITTEMGLRDESRPPYDIVRDRIMEELHRDKDLYVFVTGHSLGAALASVFCAHLLVDEDPENLVKPRVQLLCTFGQPRTGGYKFARFLDCMASTRMTSMNGEDGKPIGFRYLRFVNNNDIVPRLPPPVRFSHSPCFIFLNNLGYEEVGCETEGLSVAGVIVDEVMSRCLRTIQLPLNCVLDLASFNLTKPIVRFVVFLLPNLIYNHFPSEYERVIRGCPDPYFDEDQWVATKWQVPLLG